MTLFAEVKNASSAKPPLILLHGFGGIGAVWRPVIDRLDTDQPLLIYDLPGHGRSLESSGIGHAGDMAKVLLADLDARGIADYHLCGHSMGGAVASLIALRAPACVRSLTLLASGGFGPDIHSVALKRLAAAVTVEDLADAMDPMVAAGFVSDAAGLSLLAQARLMPRATDALQQILSAILVDRDGHIGQGMLPHAALAKLGVPTRLLWGRDDRILPVGQVENAWTQTEVTVMDGVGHMLIEEAADEVATALHTALSQG